MKKFGEYITESQDYTIAEERLRLIDEAVLKMGPKRPIASSIGRVVGRLGSRVKDKLNRPIARPLGRAVGRLGMGAKGAVGRLGTGAKDKLKTYGADVGSEMKKSIGQGLGFDIADRIGRIGRRKRYIQPQFQQDQLPAGEKLQPRSSGGY